MLEQCFIHNFVCSLTNFKSSLRAHLINLLSVVWAADAFCVSYFANLRFVQPPYRPFDCDFALANKLQRYHQH
ncbi:MAG: hypothetical protein ACTS6G_06475 [Candidatus Hodgkinia cicadicola]